MQTRYSLAAFCLLTSLCAAHTAAAQSPFAGTWKLNPEKSQMAGETLKFGPAAGGSIELTSGGMSYSFRADGKTYALPSGYAVIWRQTAPDSWTSEYRKLDNKLLSIDQWKLSADGKSLTVTATGAKANGELYTDSSVYARTEGSDGLLGTWKSTSVARSSPNELIIQEQGLGRLVFRDTAMRERSEMTLDGKDAAVFGPDVPAGVRHSLTRTGPYSLQLVEKLNGRVTDSSVYTIAEDNPKIMTQVGGPPGSTPSTIVWEKQAPKPKPEPKKTAAAEAPAHP